MKIYAGPHLEWGCGRSSGIVRRIACPLCRGLGIGQDLGTAGTQIRKRRVGEGGNPCYHAQGIVLSLNCASCGRMERRYVMTPGLEFIQ